MITINRNESSQPGVLLEECRHDLFQAPDGSSVPFIILPASPPPSTTITTTTVLLLLPLLPLLLLPGPHKQDPRLDFS